MHLAREPAKRVAHLDSLRAQLRRLAAREELLVPPLRARDIAEFDGWVRHDGEEFLYVLTGVIRLYTEFYEPVDLRRGDSAYYDASMGHNVISLSDEDATILWVTSLV